MQVCRKRGQRLELRERRSPMRIFRHKTTSRLCRVISVMGMAALLSIPKGSAKEDRPAALVFHKVDRGDVVRTLTERGVVEPANAAELVCRVRSRGPDKPASRIKWIVE